MESRNIIVIGASAGGFEALKKLVADLPKDLPASLFIVWHMSPNVRGVLPQVLNRAGGLHAANAFDGETIETSRIYVAPPDRHLLVESGRVRVTRGPRENRFRPAVDPLFRSAAAAYGRRVIGVVLSGALDDGTAGLWTIKHNGGTAVVQDPLDAEVPSMPENAMREVAVDYCISISEMAPLLARLSQEPVAETAEVVMEENAKGAQNGEKEKTEIVVIENYLPQAAAKEEIEKAVEEAINETGASSIREMGAVMKAALAKLEGKTADGRLVSEIVKAKL
jgi:two-component system chemotaxis response regulator CheB